MTPDPQPTCLSLIPPELPPSIWWPQLPIAEVLIEWCQPERVVLGGKDQGPLQHLQAVADQLSPASHVVHQQAPGSQPSKQPIDLLLLDLSDPQQEYKLDVWLEALAPSGLLLLHPPERAAAVLAPFPEFKPLIHRLHGLWIHGDSPYPVGLCHLEALASQLELKGRQLQQLADWQAAQQAEQLQRLQLLEHSTIWRATAPLRRLLDKAAVLRAKAKQTRSAIRTIAQTGQLPYPPAFKARLQQRRGRQRIDPQRPGVLIISHESSATGAPILAWNIARAFNTHSNVVILSLRNGELDQAFLDCCCIRLDLPPGVEASEEILSAGLAQLPKDIQLDYALVNTMQAWRWPHWLQRQGIASVLLIHEFAAYIRPEEAFRHACTWATTVVFSSPITHAAMVRRHPELAQVPVAILPQGRCELPSNPVVRIAPTNSVASPSQGQSGLAAIQELGAIHPTRWLETCQLILGAGAVQPRKGVDLFVETAHRLRQLAPDRPLLFVWLGDGYDPQNDFTTSIWIEDQIHRSGLNTNLHILKASTSLYTSLLPLAHLFLLTSRLDPLPNVAIDALSEAVPVLCFEQASGTATWMQEDPLLSRHCLGSYLDPGHLATKALHLLDNPLLREEIGAHGQQRAATTFAMPNYTQTLHQLGKQSQKKLKQQTLDSLLLKEKSALVMNFAADPNQAKQPDLELAYLRSWSQRINPRKPFPGFHPGVYAKHQSNQLGDEDPLAHALRSGQSNGPWSTPVIEASRDVQPPAADLQVGLHVHVFYLELLAEILKRLRHNRTKPSLMVSLNNTQASLSAVKDMLHSHGFGNAELILAPNRGRDLGPFLVECGQQLEKTCQVFGHLHTKKSVFIGSKQASQWRTFLLDNLLGNDRAAMLDVITAAFANDAKLGLVYPDDPHALGFGKNQTIAQTLCTQLGLAIDLPRELNFPVGSMFWARRGALSPLLNKGWRYEDFPEEPLGYDGTMLHAIERLLPLINQSQGFQERVTYVAGKTR